MISYPRFVEALVNPAKRAEIGLVITDDDSTALLRNEKWALEYYQEWIALAPPSEPPPGTTIPIEEQGIAEPQTPRLSRRGIVLIVAGIAVVGVLAGGAAFAATLPTAVPGAIPTATVTVPSPITETPTPSPSVDPSLRVGDKTGGYVTPFTDFEQWAIDQVRRASGYESSARQVDEGTSAIAVQTFDRQILANFDEKCELKITDPAFRKTFVGLVASESSLSEAKATEVVDIISEYCRGR